MAGPDVVTGALSVSAATGAAVITTGSVVVVGVVTRTTRRLRPPFVPRAGRSGSRSDAE